MKFRIYKYLFLFAAFFLFRPLPAQELRVNVKVEAPGIQTVNRQVFQTLEKSIRDFLQTTRWTDQTLEPHERIKANFYFVIREYKNNHYAAELNITAYRPVYNSTYETPTLMVSDKNVSFQYVEFQPLQYTPGLLDDNLTAILAYYAYMIIGYDFDSFRLNAGKPYFEEAKKIQAAAAGQAFPGWENRGKFFSRAEWVEQLLLPANDGFHKAFYTYHRQGLDYLADEPERAKRSIVRAIKLLDNLDRKKADILIKLFFDTKVDEIVKIFSDDRPTAENRELVRILTDLAPMYRNRWEQISKR